MFLHRPGDKQVEIRLKAKNPVHPKRSKPLAGEFANALLDQVVRFHVAERTGRLREYTMARAFFTTPAQSSIDQLLAELDAEELMEDDLEIEVPWQNTENSAVADSINFSLSLYSQQAVLETVNAYEAFLDCDVEVNESFVRVSLTPKVEGVEDLERSLFQSRPPSQHRRKPRRPRT